MQQFLKHKGVSIAFLGTDGSGKSTIINKIIPELVSSYTNKVYYQHLRPNLIPSIASLFGNKESLKTPTTQPHAKMPSGLMGSLLRYSYYMIDYTFGYWLKVSPKICSSDCIWIFDRYYYDFRIDKKRTRVNLPDWLLFIGQFLIPEPDLIICLGAAPELIHERKAELPIEEVKRQVNELKNFYLSHKKAIWINTDSSIELSVVETIAAIAAIINKNTKK